MAHHPCSRIIRQHPSQPPVRHFRAIGHAHHPRVNRIPDPNPATMMQTHPARPARRIQHRIQQRPVSNRIRPIHHRLRLAVRRRHRPRIQMIPPNHQRRIYFPLLHQSVKPLPHLRSLPILQPADPRRKPLKMDLLLRLMNPSVQRLLFRKCLQQFPVRYRNILRIPRQSCPSERPRPLAKQWPDIRRHKPLKIKRLL